MLLLLSHSAAAKFLFKAAKQEQYHSIANPQIKESSGLGCSTRQPGVLWTHNDSTHMPIIYAMDEQGKDLGSFHLDKMENIDWEDMDAFKYQGKHYLLIADTGNNWKFIWSHRIYIIPEPVLKKNSSAVAPAWSFYFEYEDGKSYDVESAAVDVKNESILLLTKRHKPTLMFRLPLKPADPDNIQKARLLGELPEIKNPSALDISDDGSQLSINTYHRIHRYRRASSEDEWQYDSSIKYHKLFQPEAMCLSHNEQAYFVTSERKAVLLKLQIK
jgi:hypothetical protein